MAHFSDVIKSTVNCNSKCDYKSLMLALTVTINLSSPWYGDKSKPIKHL